MTDFYIKTWIKSPHTFFFFLNKTRSVNRCLPFLNAANHLSTRKRTGRTASGRSQRSAARGPQRKAPQSFLSWVCFPFRKDVWAAGRRGRAGLCFSLVFLLPFFVFPFSLLSCGRVMARSCHVQLRKPIHFQLYDSAITQVGSDVGKSLFSTSMFSFIISLSFFVLRT